MRRYGGIRRVGKIIEIPADSNSRKFNSPDEFTPPFYGDVIDFSAIQMVLFEICFH